MGLISKGRLSALTETKLGYRLFSDKLMEAKSQSRYSATSTIFLSHSHDDKDEVKKAVVFLRSIGILVYIDWLDSAMPPFTNAETAEKIKNKIKECNKFILLATNNAISSKWCNWELGFGDAQKYINKIALFPLSENSGNWNGAEYLRIYPRIEESNYTSEYYKVIYPDGKEISVAEWFKL
ncbi:toll/interleukin-1 receptor domain-containing protein [Pseudoflavitalea sp. X16]|uniref:toll/interleukin-1 receptor domain-containing protein n=1 Tax=Paraflavitalea devenefica TaxID=2716334 RepID=UPI0014211B5F|nr:toll/interleukin-1 receptor domain-containing protein [Paraflavitalea devenefica]NII29402.1 toll/interleukin-1 receptor domain-containing protein [Paraflavitalea devenefica]